MSMTSAYFNDPTKTGWKSYRVSIPFITAKTDTNYYALITIENLHFKMNTTTIDIRNEAGAHSLSSFATQFQFQPPCNIQTWVARYVVIPSSATTFKYIGFIWQNQQLSAGGSLSQTITSLSPINTSGGCSSVIFLTGFRVTLADPTYTLSISFSLTVLSSTSVRVVLTNKSTKLIKYPWCLGGGIYFHKGELSAGISMTAIYGTLTAGDTISDVTITDLNIFYGITEFYV